MVADAITDSISAEARTRTGNIFADATRRSTAEARAIAPRSRVAGQNVSVADNGLERSNQRRVMLTTHGFIYCTRS